MTKEPPILVVNKPAAKKTVRKKKVATEPQAKLPARRKTSTARPKKVPAGKEHRWIMPEWLKTILGYMGMGVLAVAFISSFYYFFIRPYSYRWKPCYGLKAYGICIPYGYKVHGIDASHHQGKIDWEMLNILQQTNYPIRFAFLKATEGGDFKDKSFDENFEAAREYGFIRGAYHFYNPKTDPRIQAEFFIKNVKLEPGDLPPVLDIEVKSRDMNLLRRDLRLWLNIVESHYKVKPILYTSFKYKTKYLKDKFFDNYPYWIAHYYVDSVRYTGSWKFWQHNDAAMLPGIDETVDMNVFNGSLDELKRMTIPMVATKQRRSY